MVAAARTFATGRIADAIFGADGSILYAAQSDTITAYSVATGAAIRSWALTGQIGGMAVTPDGLHLVATNVSAEPIPPADPSIPGPRIIPVVDIELTTGAATTITVVRTGIASFTDVTAVSNDLLLLNAASDGESPSTLTLSTHSLAAGTASAHGTIVAAANRDAFLLERPDAFHASLLKLDPAGAIQASVSSDVFGDLAIAISPAANRTIWGARVFDADLHEIADPWPALTQQMGAAGSNSGLAFNASGTSLYELNPTYHAVFELDSGDLHVRNVFAIDADAVPSGNAFGDRLQLSADGQHMSVITGGKLQLVDLSQPTGIRGDDDSNQLHGTAADDVIYGFGGGDLIDGGAGADTMIGGSGDDVYRVDNASDVVIDSGGRDRIETSVDYRADDAIESVAFVSGASGTLRAEGAGTALYGNDGDDQLIGSTGKDILHGGAGDDRLIGNIGADRFEGTAAELSGDTIVDFGIGDRISITDASPASFSFALNSDGTLNFTGGGLLLSADLPAGYTLAPSTGMASGVDLALSLFSGENYLMTSAIRTIATGAATDATFSNDGSILYASQGNTITAYSVASGTAITSWTIGTKLGGMDITPDGQYLVVAEQTAGATHTNNPSNPFDDTQDETLYRIDLTGGAIQTYTFALPGGAAQNPGGFYDLAALTNGHVLASTSQGQVANLDLSAGVFAMTTINRAAVFSVSDDRSRILAGEQYATNPPLQVFTRDGTRTISFNSEDATGAFETPNIGIQAISSSGTRIAQYLATGLNIFDGSGHFIINLAAMYTRWSPYGRVSGLAFSRDDSSLFVMDDGTGLITQLSTADWHIVNQFKPDAIASVAQTPGAYLTSGFGNRIQVSPDGHYLEVIGDTKLQLVDLQALPIDTVTKYGTASADTIVATADHPTVDGLTGNDLLTDGGLSGVTLIGGPGDDVYHVTQAGTVIIEADTNGGNDTEYTIVSGATIAAGIETLAFETSASGQLNGDARANILRGGAGDDILAGGAGNDTLDGGNGNDIAIINVARSGAAITVNQDGSLTINSSEGTDTLANVETIRFTDQDLATSNYVIRGTSGADTLTGGPGDELIMGLAGNDTLNAMGGNDTLNGGGGTDILDGGDGFDIAVIPVFRSAAFVTVTNDGSVAIISGSSFPQDVAVLHNIEAVQFLDGVVPIGDLAVIGGAGNDSLAATANRQIMAGLDGNDVLNAGAFTQVALAGGPGDDVLIAGAGISLLNGGDGADIFRGTAANLNGHMINDFTAVDKIHITDASISNFTASITGQTLTYTGGSLTLITPPSQGIIVTADPNGGVDITARTITRLPERDFNGDGNSDVLWRNANGTVTDWLSIGSGFTNNNAFARQVGADWRIAGTGDFTGDGKADILWRNANGTVTFWSGTGSTFTDNPAVNRSVPIGWQIAGTGDFNGDGKTDILWRNANGTVTDWLSTGSNFADNGTLNRVVGLDWQIAGTGDFNGDGKSDVLWRNVDGTVTVWTGNGTSLSDAPGFAQAMGQDYRVAATGDFDGNGKTDILWRSDSGTVTTWHSNGSTFVPNNLTTSVNLDQKIVSAGDYNGDGKDDVLLRDGTGAVTPLLSDGTGFNPGPILQFGSDWNVQQAAKIKEVIPFASADFNGDGKDDLLWRHANGTVTDWLSNGPGFSDNGALARLVPLDWKIVGTGDFNGDGKADLLWRNADGTVTDWFSNGTGFSDNGSLARQVSVDWHIETTGDFNGDGRDDILWRNADGTVTDWLSNGTSFSDNGSVFFRQVSADWTIQATGDFNGDGRDDILWRNADGTVTDWLSNGSGFSDNGSIFFRQVSADWSIAGTGDFNGDGRTDILWRNADGSIIDWLSNGSGFSDNAAFFRGVPLDWQVMGVGDFNGDGKDDIEWRATDGTVTDWLSNGFGFADNAGGTRSVPLDWSIQHDGTTLLI